MWERAVRCGMAVMGTETAIHPPMTEPRVRPAMIQPQVNDVLADESAYDGDGHACFGEEHAAACGLQVRHAFEAARMKRMEARR